MNKHGYCNILVGNWKKVRDIPESLRISIATKKERRSLIESINELSKNSNLKEWEQQIYDHACQQARMLTQVLFEQMDDVLMENRGEGLEVVGYRKRWIITLFGQCKLKRRLYRDREGKGRYLLDEAMGLTKRSPLSSGVKDLCVLLASYLPFGKSEAVLDVLLPVGVSHTTIHRQLGKIADQWLSEEEKEIAEVYEQGKVPEAGERRTPILFVESDGVNIALQRERKRRAELKVGIAYEGWEKIGSQDRYRLKEKTAYMSLGDGGRFWEGFSLKLGKKYDMTGIGRVVVGGDGAPWVKEGAEILGGDYQLDRFHLRRELLRALKGDVATANGVYQACITGNVVAADTLLRSTQLKSDPDAAAEITRVRHYILNNAEGLADYRMQLDHTKSIGLRGMGAMEGNVDKLAANRMKKRGMSWTMRGIRRMACIIQLQQSGKICSWPTKRTERTPFVKPSIRPAENKDTKVAHYATWLDVNMPALSGPHSNRPWAQALRSLAHGGILL
jgi:hypothetical protein